MAEVLCPKCYARIRPYGRISAKSILGDHMKFHVDGTEEPMPRPTDEEAKPDSYTDEVCVVCHETVSRPHWNRSVSGREKADASAALGDPIRLSRFWTKRRVQLETSTWINMAFNAQHYYFKLKEDDDYPIVLYDDHLGGLNAVVWSSVSYHDPGKGRDTRDDGDCLTKPAAIEAAIRKYLKKFGCKTHYLVYDDTHGDGMREETEAAVEEIVRRQRDGD